MSSANAESASLNAAVLLRRMCGTTRIFKLLIHMRCAYTCERVFLRHKAIERWGIRQRMKYEKWSLKTRKLIFQAVFITNKKASLRKRRLAFQDRGRI
jgi:hypothetical protein